MIVFFQTFGVFIFWQPRSFFLLQKSDPTNTEVISFRIIDFGKKVLSKFSSYVPFISVSFTRTHTHPHAHTRTNMHTHSNLSQPCTHAHTLTNTHTHFYLNTTGESAHFLLDYVLQSFCVFLPTNSYLLAHPHPHIHSRTLTCTCRHTRNSFFCSTSLP